MVRICNPLSFPTGQGILDTYIIKNCAPELQQYIGTEPDKASYDKLREVLSNFTNVEVNIPTTFNISGLRNALISKSLIIYFITSESVIGGNLHKSALGTGHYLRGGGGGAKNGRGGGAREVLPL